MNKKRMSKMVLDGIEAITDELGSLSNAIGHCYDAIQLLKIACDNDLEHRKSLIAYAEQFARETEQIKVMMKTHFPETRSVVADKDHPINTYEESDSVPVTKVVVRRKKRVARRKKVQPV